MTVAQWRSTPASSPPKVKRGKSPKKEEKLLACVNRMKSESNKRKRACVKSIHDNPIMKRAKVVQSNLAPEFPSFIKNMLRSHVSGGFWLGLPKSFCHSYLPKHDAMFVLEDESGQVSESKYLVRKVGLSGGWRGFSVAHKLLEGDVVVFQLVFPFKFKVYIIRSNNSDDVDCALGLLELEADMKQVDTEESLACEKEAKSLSPVLTANPDDHIQKNTSGISDQSDKDSEDIGAEVFNGIRLSESPIRFEEVKSIGDFNILVNGLIINSEFPKYLQAKYYELCCSQKTFLHEHLLDGLNCKLISGIISETINIADAIRASKITSSVNDFAIWDKTLEAFEGLGMNVGFLRARLDQLVNLALKSKRYEDVRVERDAAKEELNILEAKLSLVKGRIARLNAEFEAMGVNCQTLELMFQKVAFAPW